MLDDRELKTVCFVTAIFALAAVGVILYQHSLHTGQIIASLGGSSPGSAASGATPQGPLIITPGSVAGTPVPGQGQLTNGLDTQVNPLEAGYNWSVGSNGDTSVG